MRARWLVLTMASLLAGLGASPELALAQGSDSVAIRVGSLEMTVSQLEERLARVPAYQLSALGGGEAGKQRWVEEALVPELLLGQEAVAQRLGDEPSVKARTQAVLSEALVVDLEDRLEQDRPITAADIRREFERSQAELTTPRRLRILRILTENEERARRLIAEARGTQGLTRWMESARELSLDKATRMRGGDLGFVRPDGSTDVPGVRVDPALFAAAERVKDGELVATPVPEGGRFAAVWRRGSLPEQKSNFDVEAPAIRKRLIRQRAAEELEKLLAGLRNGRVVLLAEALVDGVRVDPFRDFHTVEQARDRLYLSPSAGASRESGRESAPRTTPSAMPSRAP